MIRMKPQQLQKHHHRIQALYITIPLLALLSGILATIRIFCGMKPEAMSQSDGLVYKQSTFANQELFQSSAKPLKSIGMDGRPSKARLRVLLIPQIRGDSPATSIVFDKQEMVDANFPQDSSRGGDATGYFHLQNMPQKKAPSKGMKMIENDMEMQLDEAISMWYSLCITSIVVLSLGTALIVGNIVVKDWMAEDNEVDEGGSVSNKSENSHLGYQSFASDWTGDYFDKFDI